MTKQLLSSWISKISPNEKNLPLLILNGSRYTPQQAYDEVMRGTSVGDQLQQLLEQGRYGTTPDEELALVKQRLQTDILSKPQDKIMYVKIQLGGQIAFTPAQLLTEIQNETPIGLEWINGEKANMLRILQVR
jgi:hypothetical protein